MDLMAPPTAEELGQSDPEAVLLVEKGLMAPPTAEELGQSDLMAPPTSEELQGPSELESAGLGAIQGLSFNFADELEAAVRSLAPGETYDDAVAKVRARYAAAEKANPLSYGTGEVGGSIAGAFIPGVGAIGTAAKGAKLAQVAKAGAIGGGLAGFGSGEGLEDSAKSAAMGAALGGAVGTAGYGLVKGVQKVLNRPITEGAEAPLENMAARIDAEEIATPKGVVNEIEKLYNTAPEGGLSKFEYNNGFAEKLYDGTLGELPAEDDKLLRGFARELTGETMGRDTERALDLINDYKSKISKEEFLARYHDYNKVKLARETAELAVGAESPFAHKFRGFINTIVDNSDVARDVDRRRGTQFGDLFQEATRQVNKYTTDLVSQLGKMRKVVDITDEASHKKIYNAIDAKTPELRAEIMKTFSPKEKEAYEAWKGFYKDILGHIQGLGVKVEARDNYVPHKLVDRYEAIHRIEKKIKEAGGLDAIAKMDYRSDDKILTDLRKTVSYFMGDSVKSSKELARALSNIMQGNESVWLSERMASAIQQRKMEMPSYLREKNLVRLGHRYLMDTLKYAHTKDTLRKMNYQKDILSATKAHNIEGEDKDAKWIRETINAFLGGKVGIDDVTSRGLEKMQISLLRKADTLPQGSIRKGFYEHLAHSPESIRNTFMNVYPNYLGLSPKQLVNNVTGSYFALMPEVGAIYGTRRFLPIMSRGLKNYKANHEFMIRNGLTGAEWSTDLLEMGRRSTPTLTTKALDKSAKISMAPFKFSEDLNKSTMLELAKDMVANPTSPTTLAYLKTLPASRQATFASLKDPEQKLVYLATHMQDRVLYSYNKINQSGLARNLGPMLGMFTKYPIASFGKAVTHVREKGGKEGAEHLAKTMLGPYVGAAVLLAGLREAGMSPEAEELIWGKPQEHASLGQGPGRASQVGAIASMFQGKALKSPPITMVGDTVKAVSEGDLEAIGKSAKNVMSGLAPGGMASYYKAVEDLLQLTGELDPDEKLIEFGD